SRNLITLTRAKRRYKRCLITISHSAGQDLLSTGNLSSLDAKLKRAFLLIICRCLLRIDGGLPALRSRLHLVIERKALRKRKICKTRIGRGSRYRRFRATHFPSGPLSNLRRCFAAQKAIGLYYSRTNDAFN